MSTLPRTMFVVLVVVGVLAVTPVAATASSVGMAPSGDGPRAVPVYPAEAIDHGDSKSVPGTEYADVVSSMAATGLTRDRLVVRHSRFDDVEPLGHDTRQRLYDVITDDPGVYVTELARRTDTHVSTVRYHVRVLVEAGLVERTTERGRNHLSPADIDRPLSPVHVEDGTRRAILVSLDRHGTATGRELADRLGLTEATLSYHLGRLADDELVDREDDGRTVVNALATEIEDVYATAQN